MKSYQRIFLVADALMRHTPAFEQAVSLARSSGAALHIALFDREPAIIGKTLLQGDWSEDVRESWMNQRRAWLERVAASLSACGIRVSTEVIWARPELDDILSSIAGQQADLVVMDRNRHSRLERLLLTPLDLQLLEACPTAVLLVNSVEHPKPRRVLAAVDASCPVADASGLNNRILVEAQALATRCDAELQVVQVLPRDGATATADRQNFKALTDTHRIAVHNRLLLQGETVEVIADLARSDRSDILVMGTARQTLGERLMRRGVAEGLFDRVPCNLLAVKA